MCSDQHATRSPTRSASTARTAHRRSSPCCPRRPDGDPSNRTMGSAASAARRGGAAAAFDLVVRAHHKLPSSVAPSRCGPVRNRGQSHTRRSTDLGSRAPEGRAEGPGPDAAFGSVDIVEPRSRWSVSCDHTVAPSEAEFDTCRRPRPFGSTVARARRAGSMWIRQQKETPWLERRLNGGQIGRIGGPSCSRVGWSSGSTGHC